MVDSQPKLIIKRADHYELHYADYVIFTSLDNELLGVSQVHRID